MRINNFTQYGERANYDFHLRLTKQQKLRLIALADASGFNTMSEYLRFMVFQPSLDMKFNRILEVVKEIKEKVDRLENKKDI